MGGAGEKLMTLLVVLMVERISSSSFLQETSSSGGGAARAVSGVENGPPSNGGIHHYHSGFSFNLEMNQPKRCSGPYQHQFCIELNREGKTQDLRRRNEGIIWSNTAGVYRFRNSKEQLSDNRRCQSYNKGAVLLDGDRGTANRRTTATLIRSPPHESTTSLIGGGVWGWCGREEAEEGEGNKQTLRNQNHHRSDEGNSTMRDKSRARSLSKRRRRILFETSKDSTAPTTTTTNDDSRRTAKKVTDDIIMGGQNPVAQAASSPSSSSSIASSFSPPPMCSSANERSPYWLSRSNGRWSFLGINQHAWLVWSLNAFALALMRRRMFRKDVSQRFGKIFCSMFAYSLFLHLKTMFTDPLIIMVDKPYGRIYHCKFCGRCISKMDHHCVFLNNCIGMRNHKIFMQYLIVTLIATGMSTWASGMSIIRNTLLKRCLIDRPFETIATGFGSMVLLYIFIVLNDQRFLLGDPITHFGSNPWTWALPTTSRWTNEEQMLGYTRPSFRGMGESTAMDDNNDDNT